MKKGRGKKGLSRSTHGLSVEEKKMDPHLFPSSYICWSRLRGVGGGKEGKEGELEKCNPSGENGSFFRHFDPTSLNSRTQAREGKKGGGKERF